MKPGKKSSFPEFVYTHHFSAFGKFAFVSIHHIIKVTHNQVYIENKAEAPLGWRHYGIGMLFSLNRTELELNGKAWSYSQKRFYYVLPSPESQDDEEEEEKILPIILKNLGLSIPFSVEDVKNAYRQKVKSVHPDKGGNIEDFIALQKSYEKALAFFSIESH